MGPEPISAKAVERPEPISAYQVRLWPWVPPGFRPRRNEVAVPPCSDIV